MAYEIEHYGDQPTTGVRRAGAGEPNFPPGETTMGKEVVLAFATDILSDPAGDGADPTDGWARGIGVGVSRQ